MIQELEKLLEKLEAKKESALMDIKKSVELKDLYTHGGRYDGIHEAILEVSNLILKLK